MRRYKLNNILLFFVFTCCAGMAAAQQKTVNYTEDPNDVINPERGFYFFTSTNADKYTPLTIDKLKAARADHFPFANAPFKVASSLALRVFILNGFQDKPLTDQLLQKMDADFDVARQAGMKLIVRFAYNYTATPNFKPPYGDAPLSIVQGHVKQLAPLLKKNADIIAVVQMGFVGLWGEGYYTDYYGTPGKTTSQNLHDRADILEALLDAVPDPIVVQVRYPTMKQDYLLFKKQASRSARIGFHNDAFLSSSDDMGTFRSYDITAGARAANTKDVLTGYVADQAAGTAMGGESATANPPYDNCSANGGQAEIQLKRFHFTYLNGSYNPAVLTGWKPCIEDIKKSLGYRLVLQEGKYPTQVMGNDVLSATIKFDNDGYAAPINKKKVMLVLAGAGSQKTYTATLKDNVKTWAPGSRQLKIQLYVPASIPAGDYKLYLKIADINPSLTDRPEYAIRFANKDTWNEKEGMNDLNTVVSIKGVNTKKISKTKYPTLQ